jgi:DNA-binding NarL/FixJ family response regulator
MISMAPSAKTIVAVQVLIVDDHRSVADAFRTVLEGQGWVVKTAFSPQEASLSITEWTPNVALLDLEFRDSTQTGFDVAQDIFLKRPHCRVLFLTVHGSATLSDHARRMGSAGFLPKRVGLQEVVQAVRVVLGGGTCFPDIPELPSHGLTPRQLEVIGYLDRGLRYDEIAAIMLVSERTIRFHVGRAERVCGARTTAQLIGMARQGGWLFLPPAQK